MAISFLALCIYVHTNVSSTPTLALTDPILWGAWASKQQDYYQKRSLTNCSAFTCLTLTKKCKYAPHTQRENYEISLVKFLESNFLSTRIYFSCFLKYVCGFQSVCDKSTDSSHFCHFCLFLLIFTHFYSFLLISTCFYLFLLIYLLYIYLFLPTFNYSYLSLLISTHLFDLFLLVSTYFYLFLLVSIEIIGFSCLHLGSLHPRILCLN